MASGTPTWVEEDFSSFTPGRKISETAMEGRWLSVCTDRPGAHRFSSRNLPQPPDANHASGTHVEISGSGSVVFKLKEHVQGLCFSAWSAKAPFVILKARYFNENGETLREFEHVARRKPAYCTHVVESGDSISGVEISTETHGDAGIACVDGFFSLLLCC